jgi:hypothetical protein
MKKLSLFILILALPCAILAQVEYSGRDLSVSGDRLYVMKPSGELHIIDASDPSSLLPLGQIDPNLEAWCWGAKVASLGTTAYVMEYYEVGDYHGTKCSVVDASDPEYPQVTDSFEFPNINITTIAVDAERALLYVGGGALNCYTLADPLHPVLLQGLELSFYRPIADIQVQGDTIYCGQGFLDYLGFGYGEIFGIAVVDATDPAAMLEVSYMANYPMSFRDCFRVVGSNLFSLIYDEMSSDRYFRVDDISDPLAPVFLAEIPVAQHGLCMRFHDDIIYHTGGSEGVVKIDVSDPLAPVVLGVIPETLHSLDIEIFDDCHLFALSELQLTILPLCMTSVQDVPVTGPLALSAWPNPFNPRVTLSFTLPDARMARVSIHSVDGRRVLVLADRRFEGGSQELIWNGRDALGHEQPSGVYHARIESEGQQGVRRLVLLR